MLWAHPSPRNGRLQNFGTHSGFFADVGDIGREAVAEVDHRRGNPLLAQKAADSNPWNRIEMSRKILRFGSSSGKKFVQRCRRAAKSPGDVDLVARFRTRPQHRPPSRDVPGDNDVCINAIWRLRTIASGQGGFELFGERQKSFVKSVDPFLRQFSRKSQRKEGCGRLASHGGDIAQPASQTTVSHDFGGMPFPPKMDPFDTEIRSEEYIKLPTNPLDGAIISYAGDERPASSGLVSQARNEGLFGEWHAITITILASRGERRELRRQRAYPKVQ